MITARKKPTYTVSIPYGPHQRLEGIQNGKSWLKGRPESVAVVAIVG
jgi:hypothetical protein